MSCSHSWYLPLLKLLCTSLSIKTLDCALYIFVAGGWYLVQTMKMNLLVDFIGAIEQQTKEVTSFCDVIPSTPKWQGLITENIFNNESQSLPCILARLESSKFARNLEKFPWAREVEILCQREKVQQKAYGEFFYSVKKLSGQKSALDISSDDRDVRKIICATDKLEELIESKPILIDIGYIIASG